ncbi:unnamed protein product [Orchesella dallaii]|uniref:Uncharacterized protein n=1 Tax=Orchesella dallaii TaxID=48710 RepID=A0ABP1R2P5_9HEXA
MATDNERFLARRVLNLERELDIEKRKSIDSHKALCKKERLIKELTIKADEEKLTLQKLQVLVEDLESSLKVYKHKIYDVETISNYNADRFRKVHKMYLAENSRSEKIQEELKQLKASGRTNLFAQV